jgi:hypothetical protein
MNLLAAFLGLLYFIALAASAWGGWPAGPLPIDAYLAFFGGGLLAYVAIVAIVTKRALSAATLRWLMLVALLARAATLAGPHRVNSDVWRYLWDGHVLANGYNPFAYRPDDPALNAIRDRSIYARLNPAYNQLRTVYGPVAATVFALATLVPTSGDETIRVIMTIGDVTTIVLLVLLLRQLHLPEAWALVYALNPLLIDSFAGRGQMEGLLLPWLVLIPYLVQKRRTAAAGAALAAAIMIKIVVVALVPLVLMACWRSRRSGLRDGIAGLLAVALPTSIPLLMAGPHVADGLQSFAAAWRTNALLFPLVETFAGTSAAVVLAIIGVAATVTITAWQAVEGRRLGIGMAMVFITILLLGPAVFPWYVTWTLPFLPLLFASAHTRPVAWGIVAWSGMVLLWYLRFLLYPWFDSPYWPALTRLLATAAERMPEPWRVVEYALVLSTVAILAIWHGCRSRLASRRANH